MTIRDSSEPRQYELLWNQIKAARTTDKPTVSVRIHGVEGERRSLYMRIRKAVTKEKYTDVDAGLKQYRLDCSYSSITAVATFTLVLVVTKVL